MEDFLFEAIQEADVFVLVHRVDRDRLLYSFLVPPCCDIIWGVCALLLLVTIDKCLYSYVVIFVSV